MSQPAARTSGAAQPLMDPQDPQAFGCASVKQFKGTMTDVEDSIFGKMTSRQVGAAYDPLLFRFYGWIVFAELCVQTCP